LGQALLQKLESKAPQADSNNSFALMLIDGLSVREETVTALPFRIFKTQHFVSTDERLVVTEAETASRTVKELNGLPAAEEYARLVGVDVKELSPMRFAASPVVVIIDGTDYVRSIQKANPDGSLTFYCAIEEGVVFRVAHGAGLVSNLERTFEEVRAEIGKPQLVIGCDCILRKLEVSQNGLNERVAEIFVGNNTIGSAPTATGEPRDA